MAMLFLLRYQLDTGSVFNRTRPEMKRSGSRTLMCKTHQMMPRADQPPCTPSRLFYGERYQLCFPLSLEGARTQHVTPCLKAGVVGESDGNGGGLFPESRIGVEQHVGKCHGALLVSAK